MVHRDSKLGQFHVGEGRGLHELAFSKRFIRFSSRKDQLVQRYMKQKKMKEDKAKERLDLVSQANPSGHYDVYTPWLVSLDITGASEFPEDIDQIKNLLTFFDEVKRRNVPISKDILTYKNYGDLAEALEPFRGAEGEEEALPKSKREIERRLTQEGQEIVYEDGTYTVVKITSVEAASQLCRAEHWGKPDDYLNWCVKDPKWAKDFLAKAPLYLTMKDGLPYVLADEGSGNVYDRFDRAISKKVWSGEIGPILGKQLKLYFDDYPTPLNQREIYQAIKNKERLDKVYEQQSLSTKNVDRALDLGEHLRVLYEHQSMSPTNVVKAFEIGKFLRSVFKHQIIPEKIMDRVVDGVKRKRSNMYALLFLGLQKKDNKFSEALYDKIINIGKFLALVPYALPKEMQTPERMERMKGKMKGKK